MANVEAGTARRPRVLWVTAEPPDRSLGGGSIRQARLLDALAARADVDLLLAGRLDDECTRGVLGQVVEVDVPPAVPMPRWRRRLLNLRLALGRQGPTERFAWARARRVLAPHVDDAGYDVVVVQHAGLAPLLPATRQARWVIELHNVASGTAAELRGLAPGSRQRWVLGREVVKARAFERWITSSYDAVVTVSDVDDALLPGATFVVPNGVELFEPPLPPVPADPRLLFVGTLGYRPNVDGILWFAEGVWPLIRAAVPAVTLDIVGRNPVAAVAALAALPGVSVHPDVPDTRPFLERARVAVVPLRAGTGTRLKALEAWAAGRPVVGTPVGLQGLCFEPQLDALVADDVEAFAEAVQRVLTDDVLASDLAERGKVLVAKWYNWSQIGATYADIVTGSN